MTLTDKVSKPLKAIGSTFNNVATQAKNNTMLMGAGLASMVGSIVGMNKLVEPALKFQRALDEVHGYGVASDALDTLSKKALAFTASYGTSAEAFIKSSLVIDKTLTNLTANQLAHVTNTSNLLAKGLQTDANTTSDYLTKVYSAYSTQANAMGRTQWLDTIASQSAQAVKIFKTSGADLTRAFGESGAKAARLGIGYTDQLAIYGTLGSQMKGEKAAGGSKALFENLGSAGSKLGLSFTGANGQLLSTVDIIDKLNKKYGDLSLVKNSNAIKTAFGGEGAEAVMVLMKNIDKLKNGIGQLGKVHGLEHLTKMADDLTDPWDRFNGAIQALRISFGQALMPVLTPIIESLASMGKTLSKWSTMFPNITKLVGKFALIILGTTAVIGALTLAIGLFKNAFLALSIISKVTKAVVLFNIALWSNPITWIVAGIVALIAVIAAAIYYWDDITAAIGNFTSFITDKLFSGLDWLLEKFNALSEWFTSTKSWTGLIKSVWTGLLKIIAAAIDTIIEYINYIPGVNIKFRASNYVPDFSAVEEQGEKAKQAGQAVLNAQKTNTPNDGGAINKAINGVQLLSAQQQPTKQVHIENFNVTSSKSIDNTEMDNLMQMATGG